MNEFVTIAEACRLVRTDRPILHKAFKNGQLTFVTLNNRKYIKRYDLLEWDSKRVKYKKFELICLQIKQVTSEAKTYCHKCDGYGFIYSYVTCLYQDCPDKINQPDLHGRK